ncbi:hypothetical protein D3C83_262240 [compost metagenome]
MRKDIRVVPSDLLRDECIDTSRPVDHRHVGVVSERVRVPAQRHIDSELLPEVSLGVEQLPHP